MAQLLNYEQPQNFQPCPLLDGNGNSYGYLYLCTDQGLRGNPTTLPNFQSELGAPFPGPPSNNATTFPDVFSQLASTIAQCVAQMNQVLTSLHIISIDGTTYSANTPNALTPGLNQYTLLAAQLCQALGWALPGAKGDTNHRQFWPLVEFNNKTKLTAGTAWVTTAIVGNTHFYHANSQSPQSTGWPPQPSSGWPNAENALQFYSTVPGDLNQNALGAIQFWQDCEWPTPVVDDKTWCSWGFITNFALTLYEIVPVQVGQGLLGGISSSSSSATSSYAASSAMGNPRGHHK